MHYLCVACEGEGDRREDLLQSIDFFVGAVEGLKPHCKSR